MLQIDLPDFDDMMILVEEIGQLTYKKEMLSLEIKDMESAVYKEASTNVNYFVSGKSPSATHIKSCYENGGLKGEILPKRIEYAKVVSDLEKSKLRFEVLKMQVDLFRTESANKRATTL